MAVNYNRSPAASVPSINNELEKIQVALQDAVSRTGTGPNQLEATIDANSQRIINLPDPISETEPLTKRSADSFIQDASYQVSLAEAQVSLAEIQAERAKQEADRSGANANLSYGYSLQSLGYANNARNSSEAALLARLDLEHFLDEYASDVLYFPLDLGLVENPVMSVWYNLGTVTESTTPIGPVPSGSTQDYGYM